MVSLAIGALGFSACEMPRGAHFHNYGEGEITQEATCNQAGVKTFTCKCGDTYTEEKWAFAQTPLATIFCSLSAMSGGWDSQWNYLGSGHVIWGYDMSEIYGA